MKYKALEILKDEYLAEDAVHEAFIKLTHYLDGVEEIKSHKTKSFLVVIVISVSYDMYDKINRHPTCDIDKAENLFTYSEEIFENIEMEELCLKIKSLPEIYRNILNLKVYYEMRDKEISDILGISCSAVRKRLQRARNALAKLIVEGEEI